MDEVCANCECQLDEACCGEVRPYTMDGIDYCCRACAEDEECTCGCATVAAQQRAGAEKEGASQGPVA